MENGALNEPDAQEIEEVTVRTLRPEELEAVVALDAAVTGRRRPRYFELMVERAVGEAAFQISLVAEVDERVAGVLIATLYYGEYGVFEPSASIDAIVVHPERRGQGVGRALLRQLVLNLGALRIERLRTEVPWNDFELLAFFEKCEFRPSDRICLERALDPAAPARRER